MSKIGSIVLAMVASTCCVAQESAPTGAAIPSSPDASAAESQPHAMGACCTVAEGTALTLEIMDPLNSALLKRGDKFRLRLAAPLLAGDRILLAPGVEGMGEVIHAEKSRGGGKAGELLIAARYLDHQGQKIGLRGLKIGGAGKDNTGAALATAIAVGMFALFVQGGEIEIPAGTLAQAKTAADMKLPSTVQVPPGLATVASMPGQASGAGSDATSKRALPQSVDSAPPATPAEPATPQPPTVETTLEPKE